MGSELKPLAVKSNPSPIYPMNKYEWPCDSILNERKEYCQDIVSGIILLVDEDIESIVFPNPTDGLVHINIKDQKIKNIKLFNIHNELIGEYLSNDFSISDFSNGIYILLIETDKSVIVKKLIKQ